MTPCAPCAHRCPQPEPAYHGDFYDFEGMVVDPCAVQEHVPIWTGGRTLRSLRRAASLADGWTPFAVTPGEARQWLDQVELPAGLRSRASPTAQLDPIAEPARAQDILGAPKRRARPSSPSVEPRTPSMEYLEYLEALATVSADMAS